MACSSGRRSTWYWCAPWYSHRGGHVPAFGYVTDTAGATANKTLLITITGTIIMSVALENNGSTQGKLEKGDSIVMTYAAALSVSSILPRALFGQRLGRVT